MLNTIKYIEGFRKIELIRLSLFLIEFSGPFDLRARNKIESIILLNVPYLSIRQIGIINIDKIE